MELYHRKQLFGGQVELVITTKEFGEVHPKREDFSAQLKRLYDITGRKEILFPRLGFTNVLVQGESVKEGNIETFPDYKGNLLPGFLRSSFQADAGISSTLPIAICNGDCPAGVAITTPNHEGSRQLVLFHLGLMSMISKEGRSSLIEEVVLQLRSQDQQIEGFWMGHGAQACCYGLSHSDDRWGIIRRWQPEPLVVQKGPRKDQGGVDLGTIARNQLLELGIPSEKIEIDARCTVCCGNDPEQGEHYSNLLRHGSTARNAVIAWLK